MDGNFDAVRVPVGVSLGKSFSGGPFRFYPHVGTALVLDYERLYDLRSTGAESRTGLAFAGEIGLGIRVGSVMLRSSLSDMLGDPENALSGTHNWAHLAISLGWIF